MKKIITSLLLLILISSQVFAQQLSSSGNAPKKSLKLDGAWRLVSYQSNNDGKTTSLFPGLATGFQFKIWSGNEFAFVGQLKQAESSEDHYGGGTFKLQGNMYEEDIKYHFYKDIVGQNIKMSMELRNDTLVQSFPLESNGKLGKEFTVEKYVRVK